MGIIYPRTRLASTLAKLTVALLLVLLFGPVLSANAAPPPQGPIPPDDGEASGGGHGGSAEEGPPPNEYCMECHGSPYLQKVLPSGEVVDLTVDLEEYQASVHGQHGPEGYRCMRCHPNNVEFPHPELDVETRREFDIALSTGCERCHPASFDESMDGVHLIALEQGNDDAAVCGDCHTGHAVQPLSDPDTGLLLDEAAATIPLMCQGCHSEIYDLYADSVHGDALLAGNDADAPTCTDCHGVHATRGPSIGQFRLESPDLCADCHADEELMAEYDISTDVFQTYVDDFHGTTVALFPAADTDQPIPAAVCADCHGVHDIIAVDDPESPVIKENLVDTCRQCHPDATANFPGAWLSHYRPNFKDTPLVAAVNLAYVILIPTVIGGMALFVASDIPRNIRRKKETKDE